MCEEGETRGGAGVDWKSACLPSVVLSQSMVTEFWRHVVEDSPVAELNILEAKEGDGCFVSSDFFQGSVVKSQLVIVDGGEGDCRDIRPRELI